jgi:hypothetical protein
LLGWRETYESLSELESPSGDELESLATSAYMLGDEDEWMQVFERAFHWWLEDGKQLRAARCAFWIGTNLALRGELGPAGGWLGRAQRIVDAEGRECVVLGAGSSLEEGTVLQRTSKRRLPRRRRRSRR